MRLYREVDQNHDGRISKQEKERAINMFDWVDRNDDGRISPMEEEVARDEFNRIDRNNDGQISREEYHMYYGPGPGPSYGPRW